MASETFELETASTDAGTLRRVAIDPASPLAPLPTFEAHP